MSTRPECPFCGSARLAVALFSDPDGTSTPYAVVCYDCGARGPVRPTAEGAEARWAERRPTA